MKSKQNHSWTILLVVLILILVTLVYLHVRQLQPRKNAQPTDAAEETPAPEVVQPAEETKLIHVTPENMAEIEARNLTARPPTVPGALDAPVEIKQALQRQTSTLLEESRAEPESEEDRRALALSEEEVMKLEKEGRMAY